MRQHASETVRTIANAQSTTEDYLIAGVRQLGFWSSILLPFLCLFILWTQMGNTTEAVLFLLGAEMCALIIGHNHNQ